MVIVLDLGIWFLFWIDFIVNIERIGFKWIMVIKFVFCLVFLEKGLKKIWRNIWGLGIL